MKSQSDALQELCRSIVEALPSAVVVCDPSGRIVYCNPGMEALTGYDLQALAGADLRLFDWPHCPALSSIPGEAGEDPMTISTRLRGADGGPRVVVVSGRALPEGRGCLLVVRSDEAAPACLGFEQRVCEQRLHRELCEREVHYRHLVEMLSDAVFISVDGRISFANRAAVTMFSASSFSDLVGRPCHEIISDHEAFDRIQSSLDRPSPGNPVRVDELALMRLDGRPFLAEISLTKVEYGGRTALQSLCRDIDGRKLEQDYALGQRHVLEKIVDDQVALDEVLDQIVGLAEYCVQGMTASILLLDDDGRRLVHAAGPRLPGEYVEAVDGVEIGPRVGSCGTAAFIGERVVVEDIASDPLWEGYSELALRHGLRACWSQPIVDSEQRVLGTLAYYFTLPKAPDDWALHTSEGLAHLCSTAILHKRTLESMRRYESRLSEAQAIAHIGSWELDLVDDRLWWSAEVYRIFGRGPERRPEGYDDMLSCVHPEDRQKVDEAYRRSVEERQPFQVIHRIRLDGGEVRYVEARCRTDYDPDGRPVRSIGTVQDITERHLAEERLSWLSYFDELTGQPNRRLFMDRLVQSIELSARTGRPVSLLYFDLDRFKLINDSLGHSVGDRVLKTVAARVGRILRAADTLARMGGDEFAILLPDDGVEEALFVARKVIQCILEPIQVAEQDLVMAASIGVISYPSDGGDAETLLRHADIAMYRAKASGQGICIYSGEMATQMEHRLSLEQDLVRALDDDDLSLAFQCQYAMRPRGGGVAGAISGCEVLLRWRHPVKGPISPAEFIPMAEETGLIHQITQWVIERACLQAMAWEDEGIRPARIAVNLSAIQLIHRGLAADILSWIAAMGGRPEWFEIEVTETAAMHNSEVAAEIMNDLTEAGLAIAIDDFGTGHSSLAYLKRLPATTIKIDRSFVQGLPDDPDDVAIVRSTIAMAHALGKSVTAEGIETREQYAFLLQEGCDYGQGYLLGRPVDAETCTVFLREARSSTNDLAG